MRILVVAAHPDDELLGCGGTVARLSDEHEVHIAVLGEGITSRYSQRSNADPAELRQLQAQAREVAALLGAQSIEFEVFPDNRFDELPLLGIVKRVESIIDLRQPEIIYTHHPGDLNLDHALTFRAVLTATRPTQDCPVREVYAYEVGSSTEWSFNQMPRTFSPNVFVDISTTIERKIEGMRIYSGEAREFPHPRSPEALQVQARHWGAIAGLEYAEAFQLVRAVRR